MGMGVLSGQHLAYAAGVLGVAYFIGDQQLKKQQKFQIKREQKAHERLMELNRFNHQKQKELLNNVFGKNILRLVALSSVTLIGAMALNHRSKIAAKKLAESAAQKTLKVKAKTEIKTAQAKAESEVWAEKEKVAARVQEVNQNRAERIKGNVEPLEVDRSYSFDEIKGQDEAVERLKDEAIRAVHSKQLEAMQSNMKVKPRSHILLIGPPGTGKTLGVQCFTSHCNENGVPMRSYVVNVGKIDPKDVALSTEEMKKIAEKNSQEGFKTSYMLDELDTNFHFLEEMKTYMEGPTALNKDVLIIGSTNHPEKLTGPVLSRFGTPISFKSADTGVRQQILESKFKEYDLKVPDEKLLKQIAEMTAGYNGRDFKSIFANLRLNAETRALKNPSQMPSIGIPLECSPQELIAAVQKLKFKVQLTNADAYSQEAMLKKAKLESPAITV